jgi:cellulose synthase/poly-beta-1,6-N-acetylglucosamine synthase-like glycosyltransferase
MIATIIESIVTLFKKKWKKILFTFLISYYLNITFGFLWLIDIYYDLSFILKERNISVPNYAYDILLMICSIIYFIQLYNLINYLKS